MRKFAYLVLVPLALLCTAQSHAATDCATVLVPTEEQSNSDYSMMQAYMRVSASEEYDRLKSLDSASRNAAASYKLFSAEYGDSRTKEEFQEKIRKRLEHEGFSMSVSDARAVHRRYLTEAQINAWSGCVASQNYGGAVILIPPREVSKRPFPLRVTWMPQRGKDKGEITIKVSGALIDGKSIYTKHFIGPTTYSEIVVPESNSDEVIFTANIEANSDDMTVSLTRLQMIPETVTKVIACSGHACLPGDWPIGIGSPTPYGDCTVSIVVDDLNETRKVRSIDVKSIQRISGASANDFTVTKARLHPAAYSMPALRKNLQLCGYTKDIQDRRAVITLSIQYE